MLKKLSTRSLIGVAIALAATVMLVLVADALGDVLLVQVGSRPPQEVATGAIITVVLMSGAAAWATAVLARRRARRPRATFLVAATLALALSLIPPATAATGAATWWLEAMHLAVFVPLVASMAPVIPSRAETRAQRHYAEAKGGAA